MSKFATYMFLHAFLLVWNFKYVVADEANWKGENIHSYENTA